MNANVLEEKTVNLDGEEHEIMLALPSHGGAGNNGFVSISVSDGAFVRPTEKKRKILFVGDSITQGHGAENDTNSYTYRLTRHYKAETLNLGVGGSVYDADIFDDTIDFEPDMITVAYGTNDWRREKSKERYAGDCKALLQKIANRYPGAKRYCITPIWREAEMVETHPAGTLADCRVIITEIAESLGYKVIDGIDLVPHSKDYLPDGLHPNNLGYEHYFNNLIKLLD